MNITFLVGNGFDKALGLKTSYAEFYEWYSKEPSSSDAIRRFKEHIQKDITNTGGEYWSDFELGLGKYTSEFNLESVDEYIECYEDAHEKLIEYLKKESSKYDVDSYDDKIISDVANGLAVFYEELNPVEKNKIATLFKGDLLNNSRIRFITYNYTNTIDQLVNRLSSSPLKEWNSRDGKKSLIVESKLIHLHGTCDLYPIIGVNDISQVSNKKLLENIEFSSIMIKENSINAIGYYWREDAIKAINDSQIVCVYGMSLGATDAFWWETLMIWLATNSSRKLIVYWYSQDEKNTISLVKKVRNEQRIKDTLLSYCNFDESKKKYIGMQIFIIVNSNNVFRF